MNFLKKSHYILVMQLCVIGLLYISPLTDALLTPLTKILTTIFVVSIILCRFFWEKKRIQNVSISLFENYPITSVSQMSLNAERLGVAHIFIGKAIEMKKSPTWQGLFKEFSLVVKTAAYYDPVTYTPQNLYTTALSFFGNDTGPFNTSITSFLPASNILGIQYTNGLYQFSQLHYASNEIREAIQFISPYAQQGIPIDGSFEKLKSFPEQFTPKRIRQMVLLIVLCTLCFMVVSIYVARKYFA